MQMLNGVYAICEDIFRFMPFGNYAIEGVKFFLPPHFPPYCGNRNFKKFQNFKKGIQNFSQLAD